MNILLCLILTIAVFYFSYKKYSGFLSKTFGIDDKNPTPASSKCDLQDYVPGKTGVVFSHHFASIAGGGPIIGPTLALIYGFYPSLLWIVIGTIFIGAVHDFATMFISVREGGKTIADITNRTLGKTGYMLFILFVLFLAVLVTSAFLGLTATALTSLVPAKAVGIEGGAVLQTITDSKTGQEMVRIGGIASTSVIVITLFAPIMGLLLYRKGISVLSASILSIIICIFSVWIGVIYPMQLSPTIWMFVLTGYVFLASGAAVWLILQPRDFINSFILYGGLAALIISIIITGLKGSEVTYPAINIAEGGARLGYIWPMLFITIACGAISGFHSVIASGTTSKQISKETDARKIGYGAMLLEGLLAVTVIITVSSGLDFSKYSSIVFPQDAQARSNPILAFALGMGGLINSAMGLPVYFGALFGIILLEGFLATTLDTTVRLNRYLFEELWDVLFKNPPAFMKSHYFNAGLSVTLMFIFAYKQTFLTLWPIFGAANQLLAALTLLTVSVWLLKRKTKAYFAIIPAAFMIVTTTGSLIYLLVTKYIPAWNQLLIIFDLALLFLSIGLIFIAWKAVSGFIKGEAISAPEPITIPPALKGED